MHKFLQFAVDRHLNISELTYFSGGQILRLSYQHKDIYHFEYSFIKTQLQSTEQLFK